MGKCYFEARQKTARGNGISTDMMRHLHTRQYVGKSVIVTDQPVTMLGAARKQWLKLSRYIQKQRSATLDADKILKYTHAVTHMQHMRFTAKDPLDAPDADVYFLTPEKLGATPVQCQTAYLSVELDKMQIGILLEHLPQGALLVDYAGNPGLATYNIQPKIELEKALQREWQKLETFLTSYHIDIKDLAKGTLRDADTMEEALDILLGASHRFLQLAGDFQHALELARPLQLSKVIRQQYDAVILLAHRVQALSTTTFTEQFLEAYNEDDTFFLYDRTRGIVLTSGETLAQAIARQLAAGRHHLAAALERYRSRSTSIAKP